MATLSELDSGFISGTCDAMCPAAEKEERVDRNLVHKFEIIDGAPGDTSLLIKRHYRIVDTSNNAPEYFRTRYGIARSMDRLRTIMDDETMSFPVRASFLQDRYRAIWKDMHVQNWKDEFRVMVLEEIARFMILADYFCHKNSETSDAANQGSIYADKYDMELGILLLNQVLVTLMELYEKMAQVGRPCANEVEFRGYQIILQATPVQGRPAHPLEVHGIIKSCPGRILGDLHAILEIQEAFALKDWLRFFDAFRNLRFFSMVLASRMLPTVREHALKTVVKAMNPRAAPMPMSQFRELLLLNNAGAIMMCEAYDLKIVQLQNGEFGVGLKGQQKLKRNASSKPPKFGCPIPNWGALNGECPRSRFVAQIPMDSPAARMYTRFNRFRTLTCVGQICGDGTSQSCIQGVHTRGLQMKIYPMCSGKKLFMCEIQDFELGMLGYPTWTAAIQQWKSLQDMTGLSEHEAIKEYQDSCLETIWEKINHHEGRVSTENEKMPPPEAVKSTDLRVGKADVLVVGVSTQEEPTENGYLDQNETGHPESGSEDAHQSPSMAKVPNARDTYFNDEHDVKSEGRGRSTEVGFSSQDPVIEEDTRSGASSDVESTLTATNLRRIVFQEDETQGDRMRNTVVTLRREKEAKQLTAYKNEVNSLLKSIPIPVGYKVAPWCLSDLWDPSTPLKVPQLIPKAFPVTVSFTDILKKVDDHPTCGPIPISDSVFDLLWRRYRGISNLMSLKILVLAPYMFEEEMCTSLPSYWLLRKLSCRRVGLGKDHELNQMISKGPVLVHELKTKLPRKKIEREVKLHSTIWQPQLENLNELHSHLLTSTNGIIVLVDGQEDISLALDRIKHLLEIMPRDEPFPKLVILSANSLDDCDELINIFESLLDEAGFLDRTTVESVHVAPHLTHLFSDIYWGIQNEWVGHFRSRGYQVKEPDPYPLEWQKGMDPALWAIHCIAESGPLHGVLEDSGCNAERRRWIEMQECRQVAQDHTKEPELGDEICDKILNSLWQHGAPCIEVENEVAKRRRLEEKVHVERLVDEPTPLVAPTKALEMHSGQDTLEPLLDGKFLCLSIEEKFDKLQTRREGAWEMWRQQIKCWSQPDIPGSCD